jgi:hypothetical protein
VIGEHTVHVARVDGLRPPLDQRTNLGLVTSYGLSLIPLVPRRLREYHCTPNLRGIVRLTPVLVLDSLVGSSDPSDQGDPVRLTPQSLEGRWVRIQR